MRLPRFASAPRSTRRPVDWARTVLTLALVTIGASVPALGEEADWRQVRRGRELFLREWRPGDSRSHGGDGLGPLYNATSCVACHGQGGPGGGGPASTNVNLLNLAKFQVVTVGTVARTQTARGQDQGLTYNRTEVIERLHPGLRETASLVLHHSGTDARYDEWRTEVLGLKMPVTGTRLDDRPDLPDRDLIAALRGSRLATITQRNPTPLFGIGLIDAIPDGVIEEAARPAKGRSPGMGGRAHRLKGGRVGKFGWKAQVGSLQDFVLTACGNELGLESPGHRQAASPFDPDASARHSDLTGTESDELVAFVRDIPRPIVDDLSPGDSALSRRGRTLFDAVGCASCHRPSLGEVDGIYSDLLLHEMGQSLSDSGQYYGATDPDASDGPKPTEWRTPPLWGYRDSGPYLHDGRATTLQAVVDQHGGEAQASAGRFDQLSPEERSLVDLFLKSLTAPAAPNEMTRRREVAFASWERDRDAAESEAIESARRRIERDAARIADREKRDSTRAAQRVDTYLRMAEQTEKNGNSKAALKLYRELIQEFPASAAARMARDRLGLLGD